MYIYIYIYIYACVFSHWEGWVESPPTSQKSLLNNNFHVITQLNENFIFSLAVVIAPVTFLF